MSSADAGQAVMTIVRLHFKRHGEIIETSENYDVGNFPGSVPAPGDKIMSPWARVEGSRIDPENRTVYEVEERYFLPNAYGR